MEMDAVLHGRYRRIHQAYKLFILPPTNANRYVLEARLLAGQTNEQIHAKSGIPPETVGMYEQLFFTVRDRIEEVDYILGNVIGRVFQSGLSTFNPELLAKYFGFFAGPVILDMVLYGFASKRAVANDDEILGFLDEKIARNTRLQTVTLTTLLQPGKFDVRAIFEGYGQLLAVESRQNASPEHSEWVGAFIKTLAKRNPIPRGSEARNLEGTPVANYSVGTVELRASEQLRAASTHGLPYYDQLANFVLPDPDPDQHADNSKKPASN